MTQDRYIDDLERELLLFSRHHLSLKQSRPGQHLERSAYLLLTRLETDGSMSLRELAEAFRLDISTINRQVATLLKNGLVERFADPQGGMARRLRPTGAGLDLLAADRERSREGVAMVVTDWPQERIAAFAELLTRFNIDIEALEGNPWPRDRDARD
ncbi:MarR family winged helix-turn-helix transcriptional regulator [Saccharopolyspora cebuensis]|uniref:MarR family winged helix-turn-helix transcriptional regulator n=1 Tax=Saccharopolyspora cebuensis TaxID=418759 RepID=A0ABV4CA79_9PSEU